MSLAGVMGSPSNGRPYSKRKTRGGLETPARGKRFLTYSPDSGASTRATEYDELPLGVVEQIRVVGKKLRGVVRFGTSPRARELWDEAKAGVLRSLSIGYIWREWTDDGATIRVTAWQPLELSLVGVAADPTAGLFRSRSKRKPIMAKHKNVDPIEDDDNDDPTLSRSQRRATRSRESAR